MKGFVMAINPREIFSGLLILPFVMMTAFILSYKSQLSDLVETSGAGSDILMQIGPEGGFTVISPEFVNTVEGIRSGLQHRQVLAEDAGMLFDFGTADLHCMWMRETLVPLSVAFIDDFIEGIGHIVNIEDMQPQTDELHCATKSARYALEMNQGWFRHRGGQVIRCLRLTGKVCSGRLMSGCCFALGPCWLFFCCSWINGN